MADILTLKKFEALSPFEIKDELINLAKATSRATSSFRQPWIPAFAGMTPKR